MRGPLLADPHSKFISASLIRWMLYGHTQKKEGGSIVIVDIGLLQTLSNSENKRLRAVRKGEKKQTERDKNRN